MARRAEQSPRGLSVEAFRAFYRGRPDDERWELIDGVPARVTPPPTFVHQRIASNLERLLNDALEAYDPVRAAYQRGGLNLKRAVANYDPEPDVVVVDVVVAPDQQYADRFYLAAPTCWRCPTSASSAGSVNCTRALRWRRDPRGTRLIGD